MKKAIIFDMDGTLWDSADNVAISWNIAMEKFGYEREPINEADMQSVMGKTMDKIAEILFDKVEGEERKALLELACKEENDYLREHGGVLYPEIRKTMECLKEDYRLFIVSNCQAGYIEAFLDSRPEDKDAILPTYYALKFDKYFWNYKRLALQYQWEFLKFIRDEFSSVNRKHLIQSEFIPKNWNILQRMLSGLEQNLKKIHKVQSLRTRFIRRIPHKIRNALACASSFFYTFLHGEK